MNAQLSSQTHSQCIHHSIRASAGSRRRAQLGCSGSCSSSSGVWRPLPHACLARSRIQPQQQQQQQQQVPSQLGSREQVLARAAAGGGGGQQQEEQVPDASYDWVAANAALVRALPLWAGAAGFVGLLANRFLSGIAPVVDAGSSQSRADVLGILLAAVLLLTGLQWLALKPKVVDAVPLDGVVVDYVNPDVKLPKAALAEMRWAWQSLQATSRATSLVIIYQGRNVFHAGMARPGATLGSAVAGDVANGAMASGRGNYLANLVLYPGRAEFVRYLPEATQGVIVQPLGRDGVLVLGTDTLRGLSRLDQAWAAVIADKLEVSLEGYTVTGTGFKAAAGAGGGGGGGKGARR